MMKPYEGTEAYKAGFEDGKKLGWFKPYCDGYEDGYKAGKPRWIPCSERLPELPMCSAYDLDDGETWYASEQVVALSDVGGFWIAWYTVGENGGTAWIEGPSGEGLDDIVAWMPLPEPPKGEDEWE